MNWPRTSLGLLVIAVYLILASPSLAQIDTAWVRHFNGAANAWDEPHDMAIDTAGNVYVVGSSGEISADIASGLVLKYDPEGALLWQRTFTANPNVHAFARAVAVTADGYCYVTGDSPYDGGLVILKYSPTGDLLWSRAGIGTVPWDAAIDASGSLIVTGKENYGGGGNNDILTLKYSEHGDLLWSRTWDRAPGWDEGAKLAISSGGEVYVAGTSNGDVALLKYDADGDLLWWRIWDGPAHLNDLTKDVALEVDGNIYVGAITTGATHEDWVVLKYAANGDLLWERRLDLSDNGNDWFQSFALHPSGGVVATGYSYALPLWDPAKFNVSIARVAATGDSLWAVRYDGGWENEDGGRGVTTDSLGNVYVVGYAKDSSDKNCLLLKFDSLGTMTWSWYSSKPDTGKSALGAFIALGEDGEIYVAGTDSWNDPTSVDVFVTKILECSTPLPEPSVPAVVPALPCPSITYSISWNTVPNATAYQLTENDSLVYEGPDTTASAAHASGSYEYHVFAKSPACGSSVAGPSTTVSILGFPDATSVPIASDSTPCPAMNYSVSWPAAQNATSYRLLENDVSVYEGPLTSFDTNHTDGSYSYSTVAINSCGESSPSAVSGLVQIPVCPCHADPQCDGVTNVLDVILTIEVAFRGGPSIVDPNPLCNPQRTDVNCDGSTGVVDVVKIIEVAFRGINPSVSFCSACSP